MTDAQRPVLHGYFRSGTTYRVRIALNLKGVAYDYVPVNLVEGDQSKSAFLQRNPQGLVPALETAHGVMTQSPAILEWIEERWPEPALLPGDAAQRARIRAFAAAIGCDIHPIQNLRVLKRVRSEYGADQDGAVAWARHWIETGFQALETLAEAGGGSNGFLFADRPTMAEVYLIPQMYNARRFGADLSSTPRLVAADEAARALPAFADADPAVQPDAPKD